MAIQWIRIDDRLIHGQVASSWLRHVGAEQIICVSDSAASNPVQAQVLKMAAPGYMVHVFGVDKFIRVYQKNPIKKSTFLILGSTADLLKLKEGGVNITEVNYGGMRERNDRTIRYDHDLCFTAEEEEALKTLVDSGVKIDYQMAAYDAPTPLLTYISQVKKGE
ncbi:PTS system, mannose-specific IIB component [Enterococcus sp. DIV2402]|jgi:PTS system mannose-specific IIB component|uniref:PTS system, mannose-specific IIB component n=1 Tax=Candidatus Enterococcus lowellii TaxID=2230877 RepID=A0ABZ2SLW2_9ENTE|nr:PTS sugar transporter subunit IIB [Enterococcus sp. DIV2402]MBO0465283.1 PTS sugar transporter subunit IIB [Enterococcus sp. DIV2402]